MTETDLAGTPDFVPTSLAEVVPLPKACPTCGRSDVRWCFEGATSLTDPSFLLRAAWVHREGFTVHAVTWSQDQVAAARAVALRETRIMYPDESATGEDAG